MPNIEIAWVHNQDGLRIEPGVVDLLGWTAEEVAALPSPLNFLVPSHKHLGDDCPNPGIRARTASVALHHRDGGTVPCRMTVICRCGDDGEVIEAWGSIRQFADQDVVDALIAWWRGACPVARQCLACIPELYPSS